MSERQEGELSALKRITGAVAGFITVPSEAGWLRICIQASFDGVVITQVLQHPPKETGDLILAGGLLVVNRVLLRLMARARMGDM